LRRVRVAVYAAPTVDLIDGVKRPGGPLLYAREASRLLPWAEALPGCEARPAVFEHYVEGDKRSSRLIRPPGHCRPLTIDAEVGLIAPVADELSVDDTIRAALLHSTIVLDLQGFARLALSDGTVSNSGPVALSRASYVASASRLAAVKASDEDLGKGLTLPTPPKGVGLVVTMGRRGAVLLYGGQCCWYRPGRGIDADTIGAGDMFSFYLAAFLAAGRSIDEAVREAVTYTEKALARRIGLRMEGGAEPRRLPGCGYCL